MKRFHVHVAVEDLAQSVRFYATLFDAPPTVLKPDYAKWMLDDPRVNFAISAKGSKPGISHLGIQVEDEAELGEVAERLRRAERPVFKEREVTCCYAKSQKEWIADPQSVAWETFLSRGESTIYGETGAVEKLETVTQAACCAEPAPKAEAASCGCESPLA